MVQYDEDAYAPTSGSFGDIGTEEVLDGKLADAHINLIGGQRAMLNTGSVIGGSAVSFSLFDKDDDELPLSRISGAYRGSSISIGSESRVVTSYVVGSAGSNPVVVVTPAFTLSPATGVVYQIYSGTKEYMLFAASFTGQTDDAEEPVYKLFLRSSLPYLDTAFGQGILSDTGAAAGTSLASYPIPHSSIPTHPHSSPSPLPRLCSACAVACMRFLKFPASFLSISLSCRLPDALLLLEGDMLRFARNMDGRCMRGGRLFRLHLLCILCVSRPHRHQLVWTARKHPRSGR